MSDLDLTTAVQDVLEGKRLGRSVALSLYRDLPTHELGRLADIVRARKHPKGIVTYITVSYTHLTLPTILRV